MRTSKFSETQIVAILKQQDAGLKVADICREHGISQACFYKWRSKYGGMDASMLKRVKAFDSTQAAKDLLPGKQYTSQSLKTLIHLESSDFFCFLRSTAYSQRNAQHAVRSFSAIALPFLKSLDQT